MSELLIDMNETLMMIDEALSDIVSAKIVLEYVGKNSEHVQQARFEQFNRSIDEIVTNLFTISMCIEEEMEAER